MNEGSFFHWSSTSVKHYLKLIYKTRYPVQRRECKYLDAQNAQAIETWQRDAEPEAAAAFDGFRRRVRQ